MPRPNTENTEHSAELMAAKARMRLLMGFLVMVVFILCGYFYWISQELNRIQSPSMLMSPSSSPEALPLKPRSASIPNAIVAQADEVESTSFPSHAEQEKIVASMELHPFSPRALSEVDEKMAMKPEHLILYAPIIQSAIASTLFKPFKTEEKSIEEVNSPVNRDISLRKNRRQLTQGEDEKLFSPVIHIRVEQGYAHKGDDVEMEPSEQSFSIESAHAAIGESSE